MSRVAELIEPLYTDIRGKTARETLRRLSREKLRIAAPLLGCGYDDLYRRHRRRRIKRIATGTAAVVAAAGIVAAMLGNMDADRRNVAATLRYHWAGTAIEQAAPGLGMRYLLDSLALHPRSTVAQTVRLALLMQRESWPVAVHTEKGRLIGNTLAGRARYTTSACFQAMGSGPMWRGACCRF